MTRDELISLCSKQMEHISSLNKQAVEMRWGTNKQMQELTEELEDALASVNFYTEQCAELKDERKKLKAENEKLKENVMDEYGD